MADATFWFCHRCREEQVDVSELRIWSDRGYRSVIPENQEKPPFPMPNCEHGLCIRCAVCYVREALGNAAVEVKAEGIRCPMHCEGCAAFVTLNCVRDLVLASSEETPATGGPMFMAEADKLERFMAEATMPPRHRWTWRRREDRRRLGRDRATTVMLRKSSKGCPNCSMPIVHYHGHQCHHITGCPNCGQHFCYVCLRRHGSPGRHRFNTWCCHRSSFCNPHSISKNLVMEPFPHDRRCGCPICPDCRVGVPCANCDGSCVVCHGSVKPAPLEIEAKSPSASWIKWACRVRRCLRPVEPRWSA